MTRVVNGQQPLPACLLACLPVCLCVTSLLWVTVSVAWPVVQYIGHASHIIPHVCEGGRGLAAGGSLYSEAVLVVVGGLAIASLEALCKFERD